MDVEVEGWDSALNFLEGGFEEPAPAVDIGG